MLLIYTQKITPRIIYIFKHVCTNILGIPVKFTSKIEEFIAHEEMKLSYGKQAMGNELFIQKVDLLLEQGLSEVDVKVQPWEDTFCFFAVPETSDIPFDIFAASFYLLSRYEEYMPHVKDEEGRFPAAESLAFQGGFLRTPVVDVWAYKFDRVLRQRFPDHKSIERKYESKAVITVHHIYNFQNKGFIRSWVGMHVDLFRLNFSRILDRTRVLVGLKKDPFDVFEELIELIKEHKLQMIFMFQLSDFSIYDRNISPNRISYRSTIKYVADYAKVGLLLGYYAVKELKTLRKEKRRLEEIVHRPVENVMNNKYNLVLPENYNNLTELEIKNDYSMGYPAALGFRAGTCTPFLFYDINIEATTPLKVHPYIFNSRILEKTDATIAKSEIAQAIKEVKNVGGSFKAIFSNQDFSEYSNKELYLGILKQIHEIK